MAFVALGAVAAALCLIGYRLGVQPHTSCRTTQLWTRQIVIEHAIGDVITCASYMAISARAIHIVRARKDLPLRGAIGAVILCASLFVASCGIGHGLDQIVAWFGGDAIWWSAKQRLFTALISAATVLVLFELTPTIVSLPTNESLRRANDELKAALVRETERRIGMQQFLDAAPDAMILVNNAGLIIQLNDAAARMFGYEQTELIGQPVELLIPDARRAGHKERREAYAKEPRNREMGSDLAIEGRRKDGSSFAADIKLSPFEASVLAAIRDVSARRSEETRLSELVRQLQSKETELSAALALSRAKDESIRELSTPVLELGPGMLLSPIVGTLDSQRAAQLTDQISERVVETQARVVILDVRGVPLVDTSVASALVKLAKTVDLLGAKCRMTGLRPAVAQAIIELGIDDISRSMSTHATLADGINATRVK